MKIRKLFTVLLSFLTMINLFSCHPNDDPSTDETPDLPKGIITMSVNGFDIAYKFNDDVFNLEEIDRLIRVDDDSVLIFSADAFSSHPLQEGQVLYSLATSLLPCGLANRIVKIEQLGSEYVVTTSPVALDAIFEYLVIKGSKVMSDSIDGLVDDDGLAYETSYEQFTEALLTDSDFVVTDTLAEDTIYYQQKIPRRTKVLDTSLTIEVEKGIAKGKLGLNSTLYIDIDLSKKKYEIVIIPSCDVQLGIDCHGEVEKRYPLFHKKDIFNQAFWIGPVFLRTFEGVEVDLVSKISGDFQIGYMKNMSVKAGINQSGVIFENLTKETSDGMFTNVQVNASAQVGVECAFVLGVYLFTNNFESQIRPTVSLNLSTEFQLSNSENLWYTNPSLNLSCSAGVAAEAMIKLRKDTIGSVSGEISRELFRYGFPLLPTIVQEVRVNQDNSSVTPKFEASYIYKGGLLSKFMTVKPVLNIYKNNTRQQVLTDDTQTPITHNQLSNHRFTITNIDKDQIYVARPAIMVVGLNMDREGEQFSCATPTVVITDIIQTYSLQGNFFYMNESWEYLYGHDVYISIKGSENCSEVGLYAPRSEVQYNPLTLADGRYKMLWRGYSHRLSDTYTLIPYAYLLQQQNIKYFEEVYFPLSWGSIGNVFTNSQRSAHRRVDAPSLSDAQCDEIISITKLTD